MEKTATRISEEKSTQGNLYFRKTHLVYAYRQIPLHHEIQKDCNFNITGGDPIGNYRF